MAYNIGKKRLNALLNEFLKKQNKGMDSVEKHFERVEFREKKALEAKNTAAERKIDESLKAIADLKKELKISDFQKAKKTQELKDNEELVNKLKNETKNNTKLISKLPGNIKAKISEYKGKLKEFYKLTTSFLKIMDTKMDIDRMLKISEDHLNRVKEIEDEIRLRDFINDCKIELKIKHNNKEFKIDNYNQYVAFYLETILYHILEAVEEQKILQEKQILAETALAYARGSQKYSNLAKLEVEFFDDLENFCECEFIQIIAHKEFEDFNLSKATSYFLDAKNRLITIKGLGKEFQNLVKEKIKVADAWASDAYHLIFLLNSYKNWQGVMDSKNDELREIAQITKDKVEDFITSQYGFPEENKINEITRSMRWPSAITPPVLDKVQPIH